jgi:hypothetical protein
MSHYVVPESTTEVFYPVSKRKKIVNHKRRMMLVYLTNCVVISSILALFLNGSPLIYAQEKEQFLTHQDAAGKFTIQYPGDWEKRENQSGGVSFYIPETSAVFSIYVQSLGQLEELFHEQVESLEQVTDIHVQRLQSSTFGKRLIPGGVNSTTIADIRVFKTESDPGPLSFSLDKMLHLWALVGDDAFTFTFSARPAVYEEYLPTIEKMLDSYVFLNPPTAPTATQVTEQEDTPNEKGQIDLSGRTTEELEDFISIEESLSGRFGENENSVVNATELCKILVSRSDASDSSLTACRDVLNKSTSTISVVESDDESFATALQNGTNATESGQAASNETVGWQTYQDDQYGFKIQYPTEWGVVEPTSPFALNPNIQAAPPAQTGVTISPNDEPSDTIAKTRVSVDVQNTSRTLDPDTLEVTSLPPEHYAQSFIQGMTGLIEGSTLDTLKNEATTVSGQPAWQVEYISGYQGMQTIYGKVFYVVKDGKLFEIAFSTGPLKVPETRPIGEIIIESFQLTTPRAPAPNATESTDSVPQSDPELILPNSPLASPEEENSDEENSDPDEDE